jgi:two-component system response regulator ChvI
MNVSGTSSIRILLFEDDESYRESLVAQLSEQGFVVQGFADATSLLSSFDSAVEADIIVLEWNFTNASGIDVLQQLRRRGANLPVVFLTGHAMAADETLAFDSGATDFIDKARGIEVLARRLKLAVKVNARADIHTERSMVCGKLSLKPDCSRAYWDGVDLDLTIGEYNLVHLLASNVGRYITYRAIYDRVHREGFVAGNGKKGYWANVRATINRVRRKFRKRDPAFDEIVNYVAFGYCWGKPVEYFRQ